MTGVQGMFVLKALHFGSDGLQNKYAYPVPA